MDRATQIELSREIFVHLDAGTTCIADEVTRNPIEVYTSPERLRKEREVLFRESPLFLGLSCHVPQPGDYFTDEHSEVPILVVRGKDGRARAFANVCRHRGARVASGCGRSGGKLICPYHNWTYDLDGRLAAIPDRRSFPGVALEEHGLVPLPLVEKHGMLFVRPNPGSAPFDLDAHLCGLAPELASYGLDRYHHYEGRVLRQKMNWKLVLDTFLEPYHLGALHHQTVGPIFVPNLCLFHPFGPHLRETLPRRTIVEMRDRPTEEWDLVRYTALVYVLFPNTAFIMQTDHVETWRVYPWQGRTDEAVMTLDFYVPEPAESESARRHWDRNMDLTIRTVQDEDFPTVEAIQAGFAAGVQNHVTFGRNEPALAHFETAVTRAIGENGERRT